jgi:hypothetical protein
VRPLAIDADSLRPGRTLGRGGQGRVVEVSFLGEPASEPLVAKWYLPDVAVDPAALTRLVSWRRRLGAEDLAVLDDVACWPRAVLVRHGRAAGVLLPRVPAPFSFELAHPSGARGPVLRELQYLIAGPALLARRGISGESPTTRLRLLVAFVSAVSFLHRREVVLGDMSVKNVLWSAGRGVHLLDCDALRLTGTNPAVSQPNSPGWDDPAFPGTQNQQSDRYKLALTVLRVLARDFHTRDPERAAVALGREFLPVVRAGLSRDPDARPPASAWLHPLRRRITQLTEQEEEVTDMTNEQTTSAGGDRE